MKKKKERKNEHAACHKVAAREGPQLGTTGKRLTELEEQVNGIVADGALKMWAIMAQLAVERYQDAWYVA